MSQDWKAPITPPAEFDAVRRRLVMAQRVILDAENALLAQEVVRETGRRNRDTSPGSRRG